MANKVNMKPPKYINTVVSRNDTVQAALARETEAIKARASAKLAQHRKTGEHRITTRKGAVDHYVVLEGPYAASVELGGRTRSGGFREGIHALRSR